MEISEFISSIPPERRESFTTIHNAILANDPTVIPVVKPMMGKEMILYEERCYMKYGLASTKSNLSLHCMPMYMNKAIHAKYEVLAPFAKFQKGCINFTGETELPFPVLVSLIAECSSVNIAEVLANRKKK